MPRRRSAAHQAGGSHSPLGKIFTLSQHAKRNPDAIDSSLHRLVAVEEGITDIDLDPRFLLPLLREGPLSSQAVALMKEQQEHHHHHHRSASAAFAGVNIAIALQLQSVILSRNYITNITGIVQFRAVTRLSLVGNYIHAINDCLPLGHLEHLTHLSMELNPVTYLPYYRHHMVTICSDGTTSRLKQLDGKAVDKQALFKAKAGLDKELAWIQSIAAAYTLLMQLEVAHKKLVMHVELMALFGYSGQQAAIGTLETFLKVSLNGIVFTLTEEQVVHTIRKEVVNELNRKLAKKNVRRSANSTFTSAVWDAAFSQVAADVQQRTHLLLLELQQMFDAVASPTSKSSHVEAEEEKSRRLRVLWLDWLSDARKLQLAYLELMRERESSGEKQARQHRASRRSSTTTIDGDTPRELSPQPKRESSTLVAPKPLPQRRESIDTTATRSNSNVQGTPNKASEGRSGSNTVSTAPSSAPSSAPSPTKEPLEQTVCFKEDDLPPEPSQTRPQPLAQQQHQQPSSSTIDDSKEDLLEAGALEWHHAVLLRKVFSRWSIQHQCETHRRRSSRKVCLAVWRRKLKETKDLAHATDANSHRLKAHVFKSWYNKSDQTSTAEQLQLEAFERRWAKKRSFNFWAKRSFEEQLVRRHQERVVSEMMPQQSERKLGGNAATSNDHPAAAAAATCMPRVFSDNPKAALQSLWICWRLKYDASRSAAQGGATPSSSAEVSFANTTFEPQPRDDPAPQPLPTTNGNDNGDEGMASSVSSVCPDEADGGNSSVSTSSPPLHPSTPPPAAQFVEEAAIKLREKIITSMQSWNQRHVMSQYWHRWRQAASHPVSSPSRRPVAEVSPHLDSVPQPSTATVATATTTASSATHSVQATQVLTAAAAQTVPVADRLQIEEEVRTAMVASENIRLNDTIVGMKARLLALEETYEKRIHDAEATISHWHHQAQHHSSVQSGLHVTNRNLRFQLARSRTETINAKSACKAAEHDALRFRAERDTAVAVAASPPPPPPLPSAPQQVYFDKSPPRAQIPAHDLRPPQPVQHQQSSPSRLSTFHPVAAAVDYGHNVTPQRERYQQQQQQVPNMAPSTTNYTVALDGGSPPVSCTCDSQLLDGVLGGCRYCAAVNQHNTSELLRRASAATQSLREKEQRLRRSLQHATHTSSLHH